MIPVTTRTTLAALAVALGACAPGVVADADATSPATAAVVVVDASEAVTLLAERDELTIIDVRTPEEFAEGHLEGAVLIDIQGPAFQASLEELDRDGAYLVYCRSGNRSANAVAAMEELGFVEVYDAGGLADLASAGAPIAG